MVLQTFTDHDRLTNFTMTKSTFQYHCIKFNAQIEHKNTQLRPVIQVNHCVAITLWYLATCTEYHMISHLFGVGRSTVCEIVHETVDTIVCVLQREYIRFPVADQQRNTVRGFETAWGFPQCVGAIDGCHIPVQAPALNHTDYYNRKGWYSILSCCGQ